VLAGLLVVLMMLTGFRAAVHALDDVSNINCGDQQFTFQRKCGLPTATEQNGQVWIYDRRPDDFVYDVTFTQGQVERIQVSGND